MNDLPRPHARFIIGFRYTPSRGKEHAIENYEPSIADRSRNTTVCGLTVFKTLDDDFERNPHNRCKRCEYHVARHRGRLT